MLPEKLLDLSYLDDEVVPRFFTAKDAVWIRGLMGEFDGFVGRSGQELDEAEGRLVRACKQNGATWRGAAAMFKVLSRAWSRKVHAAAKPVEIRRILFERVGMGCPRQQAIQETAVDLGIKPEEVLEGLFADRIGERKVQAPEHNIDPQHAIELYNLELVQSLLARSERVAALVRENVRSVVRYAKLKGLLCTYSVDGMGTMIELSGPLSLFRNTTKYGNALATFFPSLVVTPGWSLIASCMLRPPPWSEEAQFDDVVPPRRYRFVLDASAPVRCTHGLPSDADSAVERKLMRDVRRVKRGWEIHRETTAVRVGTSVFFPDFKLVRGDRQVLVEIVGFYTPEYLETKLKKLREANLTNFIVCIDRSLACDDGEITADVVLRYERRVDAMVLLDAAEGLGG